MLAEVLPAALLSSGCGHVCIVACASGRCGGGGGPSSFMSHMTYKLPSCLRLLSHGPNRCHAQPLGRLGNLASGCAALCRRNSQMKERTAGSPDPRVPPGSTDTAQNVGSWAPALCLLLPRFSFSVCYLGFCPMLLSGAVDAIPSRQLPT